MASPVDAIVDTSALTAILLHERDAADYLQALTQVSRWGIAAPNRTELLMVATVRLGNKGMDFARTLLQRCQIQTLPLDETLADAAAAAYERYGKGRHPAGLNFGDCFAYALAHQHRIPLLFKGDDFARTDVHRLS